MTNVGRNRSSRPGSVAPTSVVRFGARDRVLVIDGSDDSRKRVALMLGDAGYVAFEQPSPIGVTRTLLAHSIPAVVIDLGMPGLSGEMLVGLLRKNPRLDGLVIVVITSVEGGSQSARQEPRDVDAVVLREQLEFRLIPTIERLMRTSGLQQKAPSLAELAAALRPDDPPDSE